LHREPYPFDFERVAGEAARRGVCLEINGSPERMDLGSNFVRSAKALGAKFVISTDSHHPKSLGINMPYGVIVARRGGLEESDVLNTLPVDKFAEAIRKK
jgi:DNA polymerase (family 10)